MERIHKGFYEGYVVLLASLGLASSPSLAQARDVIEVSTPGQLEAAVQLPGVIVKAAAGTYALTANLVLAEDTDLIGSNEMVDSDGDGVPDPIGGPDDFVVAGTETLIVGNAADPGFWTISGLGWNRVSQVTVLLPAAPRGGIEAEEVSDCLIDGTPGAPAPGNPSGRNDLGTFVGNSACSGCMAKGTFRGNVLRDLGAGAGFANNNSTDSSVKVDLSGNRIYRNSTGVQPSAGQSSNNCELSVVSIGNLFAGNGQGYAAFGGAGLNVFDPANLNGSQGNHLRLHSVKDVFRDNTASGILVFAGLRRPGATGVFSAPMNDNEVRLDLLDASLEQGPANDIVLVAGFTQPATGPTPGTGNVIEALIRRSSVRADATPELLLANGNAGGATTNEVVLIGSDVAFQVTNDPFDLNTFGVNFCEFFNPPCN